MQEISLTNIHPYLVLVFFSCVQGGTFICIATVINELGEQIRKTIRAPYGVLFDDALSVMTR